MTYQKRSDDSAPVPATNFAAGASGGRTMFTDSTEGDEITPARILAMLKGQNERCPLTGLQLTAENIALDHIMPLAKGGADSMTNIRAVHKVVNTMKGTLTDGDFLHWCRLVSK